MQLLKYLDQEVVQDACPFLLKAKVYIFEYSSTGDNIVCFHNYFVGHRCSVKGCGNVIVLDGNMKNARTVCSCNSVGEIVFEGIGNVVIGT